MLFSEALDTKRKALRVNLDAQIYGSFAEIGAGQEVARNFFTAGAASGTIAKTMSAYDMAFSNAIYGQEENGRYVSKSRLLKMLEHEFDLLLERLVNEKYSNFTFFAFADTVTTLNYNRSNDPNGWVGIRFQLYPGHASNHILFHVRLLDSDSNLQQRVLGILGVNLIYAAFFYRDDYRQMIESFADNISPGSVEIDLIHVEGADFLGIDNRLLNLYLITKGYSSASIFTADGMVHHPKDYLYKKNLLILRTRLNQKHAYRPEIKEAALRQFALEQKSAVDGGPATHIFLIELALEKSNTAENSSDDFSTMLSRIEELSQDNQIVMVSNFARHHNLARYIARFKPGKVRLVISSRSLGHIFNSAHYGENYTTELLAYISNLFSQEVQLYVYPEVNKLTGNLLTLGQLEISTEAASLFAFLMQNNYLREISLSVTEQST